MYILPNSIRFQASGNNIVYIHPRRKAIITIIPGLLLGRIRVWRIRLGQNHAWNPSVQKKQQQKDQNLHKKNFKIFKKLTNAILSLHCVVPSRFGRKKVLVVCATLQAVVGILIAFVTVTSLYLFMALRFTLIFLGYSTYMAAYVTGKWSDIDEEEEEEVLER